MLPLALHDSISWEADVHIRVQRAVWGYDPSLGKGFRMQGFN